jgi:thioredoxin-related protein
MHESMGIYCENFKKEMKEDWHLERIYEDRTDGHP